MAIYWAGKRYGVALDLRRPEPTRPWLVQINGQTVSRHATKDDALRARLRLMPGTVSHK